MKLNERYNIYFILFILLPGFSSYAQNSTIPGEVFMPYPTLINLAVEWTIEGDDNQNGMVSVNYREKGEGSWLEGMPLRRVPAGENIGFTWKNKHSGAVFDLKPGTTYELHLMLEDPDGGSAERTVEANYQATPGHR